MTVTDYGASKSREKLPCLRCGLAAALHAGGWQCLFLPTRLELGDVAKRISRAYQFGVLAVYDTDGSAPPPPWADSFGTWTAEDE